MRTPSSLTGPVVALLVAAPALAGCSSGTDGEAVRTGGRVLNVISTDRTCEVSSLEVPAGTLTFEVTNSGAEVTEFYLLGEDGLRVVAEVENIGPASTRQVTLNAAPGSYVTACKPGMKGEGIRANFTVTDSEEKAVVTADQQTLVDEAVSQYAAYVRDQVDQLLTKTEEFVELYTSGADDAARRLYPDARTHWERVETVAESFGDLDPRMDAREADLEPGEAWTGWHRIEKDLWPARAEDYTALSAPQRAALAEALLADTVVLDTRVQTLTYTVDQIANGSRGLLEEVALGKVTGEEEFWSRTDLWDFQANIDGAKVAYAGVRPILEGADPELVGVLDERFDALQALLDRQRVGDGFRYYDELSQDQIKALSDSVNALSEPLSRLTAAVLA
ncbi:iron uptake system protein EfeO [Nocardioides sp.]|uniref:iron uptake system protein EfeO n=1 Tax=Nocardioides sp. TaxID=35761 RepID=UPI0035695E1C